MKHLYRLLTVSLLLLASTQARAVLPAGNSGDPLYVNEFSVSLSTTIAVTSPAAASTVISSTFTGLGSYRYMTVAANLVGATGGVLDVYIQTSPDGGTTWFDYAHYTQLTAGNAAVTKIFTVARSGQQTTITTTGTNAVPALGAGTVVGGDFTDRIRFVFVAGASTSAGASLTFKIYAGS